MNKIVKYSLISLLFAGVLAGTNLPTNVNNVSNDLLESAAVEGRNGVSVRNVQVGENLEAFVSNTCVQVGQDDEALYLRFITAVSGPVESVTYTRTSENLGTKVANVDVVYKSVTANDEALYYDGNSFVGEETEATDNYYFEVLL